MVNWEIDGFKEYRLLSSLRWGKEGEQAAFLVKQANRKENTYDSSLWVGSRQEGWKPAIKGNIKQFWWFNEREILLIYKEGKEEQEKEPPVFPETKLYTWTVKTCEEPVLWCRLPFEMEDMVPLGDTRFLFLAEYDPFRERMLEKAGGDKTKAEEWIREEEEYQVLEKLPFWENGGSYTGEKKSRIYLWDGEKATPITGTEGSAEQMRLSPDKRYLYYIWEKSQKVIPLENQMMEFDLQENKLAEISVSGHFCHHSYAILDNKKLLVFGSDMKKHGMNQNGSFYRLDTGLKDAVPLYQQGEYTYVDSVGTDIKMASPSPMVVKEGKVYWVTTKGYSSHLMCIEAETGKITQLTKEEGAVHEFALTEGGIYFTAMRGLQGVELYKLEENGRENQLTEFNQPLQAKYQTQPLEKCSFPNEEGREIVGWIMKPAGWQEGKKYPAILNIHGGPKTVYGNIMFHEMQYWAGQGYGVFFCNPTGGDGGGDLFADIRGRYGEIDYRDLMQFTDLVLEKHPWIDKKRLGVTGGSYGGFMTNWIIGHTGRFAAAVSQRSISNWISMGLTSDIGYFFMPDQLAGDIWQDTDKIWGQSPLKYANRVTTPTLFVHSDQDYRCWMAEGLQMYSALQLAGVDTRLCLFHGENHELSRSGKPRHRVRRLQEITRWFDRYLKEK